MGLQFLRYYGDLFDFGIYVITPCLCVTDRQPSLYASFKELKIYLPKSTQNNFKNSVVKTL